MQCAASKGSAALSHVHPRPTSGHSGRAFERDLCPIGVLPPQPVAVAPIHDTPPPRLVREIPAERLPDTGLEGLRGTEAELLFDLARVDGIPAIVAGPV